MWIKICANTSLGDAQLAVDLGANALGFVFAPSSRRVTAEQVGKITACLMGKDVERVGVFTGTEADEVRAAVDVAGLTGVQLHGERRLELIEALRAGFGEGISITQTLHWPTDSKGGFPIGEHLSCALEELRAQGIVDRVLVDARRGQMLGGTGLRFDWNEAESLFAGAGEMRMVLAGGLGVENVGEGIARLRPWGVDVASGVEREPGRKDPDRLRLFLERARAAG